MGVESDRPEARVSAEQRARLESASSLGRTLVPADYFDELVNALDRPDQAPTLTTAARRIARPQL